MLRDMGSAGSNPRTQHIKAKFEMYKDDRIHVCRETPEHTDMLVSEYRL